MAQEKRNLKILLVMCLTVLLVLSACNRNEVEKPTPEQGVLNGNTYENSALGIHFEKRTGWEFIESGEFSEFCVQNEEKTEIDRKSVV